MHTSGTSSHTRSWIPSFAAGHQHAPCGIPSPPLCALFGSHTSAQHLHRASNPACRSKLSESEVILESPKFSGIIKKRVIPRRQRESLFSGASRHCCGELILNFTCFIPRTSWGLVISEKTTFPSHAFMIKLYLRSGKHSEKMRHPLQFGGRSPLYAICIS